MKQCELDVNVFEKLVAVAPRFRRYRSEFLIFIHTDHFEWSENYVNVNAKCDFF